MTQAEAFAALDNWDEGVPYEAITYLREESTTSELQQRIAKGLSDHVLKQFPKRLTVEQARQFHAFLWYLIAAYPHAHPDMLRPWLNTHRAACELSSSFRLTYDELWIAVKDEAGLLTNRLLKLEPEATVEPVLTHLDTCLRETQQPDLMDFYNIALHIEDITPHQDRILKIFKHQRNHDSQMWAAPMAYRQIPGTDKAIQDQIDIFYLDKLTGQITDMYRASKIGELQEAIDIWKKMQKNPNAPYEYSDLELSSEEWNTRVKWLEETRPEQWMA